MYNYFESKNNYNEIAFECSNPVLSAELNELQSIIKNGLADYIRDSGKSGVFSDLDYSIASNGVVTFNKAVICYLDGERFCIPKGHSFKLADDFSDGDTIVVFIETWLEKAVPSTVLTAYGGEGLETITNNIRPPYVPEDADVNNRIVKKWRVRAEVINTGAKYNGSSDKYPYLGFTDASNCSPMYVKGAKSTLVRPTEIDATKVFFPKDATDNLWIAGDGSDEFSDAYRVFGGYVLALPLIRAVKTISEGNVSYTTKQEGESSGVGLIIKEVIEARGEYGSLGERLTNIIGGEGAVNVYLSETEPDYDGIWFSMDDQMDEGDPVEDNPLVDEFKKFNNENYLTARNSYFNTSKKVSSVDPQCNGFVSNEKIYGKTFQNLFNPNGVKAIYETYGESLYRLDIIDDKNNMYKTEKYTIVNLSNKVITVGKYNTQINHHTQEIDVQPNSYRVISLVEQETLRNLLGKISNGWENSDKSKEELEKSLIVLEGDWTEKEIPTEYFSGFKSVESPIEIKAVGKNILNLVECNTLGVTTTNKEIIYKSCEIYLSSSKTYTLSFNVEEGAESVLTGDKSHLTDLEFWSSGHRLLIYKLGKSKDINMCAKDGSFTFSPSESGVYSISTRYTCLVSEDFPSDPYSNVQLEEGTEATEYEPYKEEVQTIYTEPLRSIGDTRDEIDIDRGVIVRKITAFNYDEAHVIYSSQSTDSNIGFTVHEGFYYNVSQGRKFKDIKNIVADKCKIYGEDEAGDGISIKPKDDLYFVKQGGLDGAIKRSLLETEDLDGINKYLKSHPVHLLMELAEPIEEKINTPPLRVFKDAKHLLLNGIVIPQTEFLLPQNIKAQVDNNTEEIKRVGGNLVIPSNPNILINGDLRNPVNQKGKTSYTSSEYSVDRWFIKETKLDILDDNVLITNITEGKNGVMKQRLPFSEMRVYPGDVVTLSVCYRTNNRVKLSLSITDKGELAGEVLPKSSAFRTHSITTVIPSGVIKSDILDSALTFCDATEGDFINVKWMKLEKGDKATPFEARPRIEELNLCQRYYSEVFFKGRAISANNIVLDMSHSALRTMPTLNLISSLGGINKVCECTPSYGNSGYNGIDVGGISHYNGGSHAIRNIVFNQSPLTIGEWYSGILRMDAEVY